MPFNGSGEFNLVYNWEADAAASIDIIASRMDGQEADMASNGFDNCLTRDGQGQATADLPMAGYKHTNVANGSASTDYAAYGQLLAVAALIQNGTSNWIAAGGTSDAVTATYAPALVSLVDGQLCYFRATAANLTTTPTFSPNSLTPNNIVKNGGQALAVGDISGANKEVILRYNLGNTVWEMLNPPSVPVGGCVPYFGGTIPSGFALPQGQNLSATTYPAANVVLGTTYGNPGGGNFTMPDARGRVLANLDAGGSGRITSAGGNFDGTVLGNSGGAQNQTIAQGNLPSVNFTVSISSGQGSHTHGPGAGTGFAIVGTGTSQIGGGSGAGSTPNTASATLPAMTGTAASGGSGTALPVVQPTLMVNIMMRIA